MTAGLRTSPSTRVRSKNIEYIAGVDHIRAFASLLVVFHHSFWMLRSRLQPPGLVVDNWKFTDNLFYSLVIETHIVVTLFFVLSGFVFTLAGDGNTFATVSSCATVCCVSCRCI